MALRLQRDDLIAGKAGAGTVVDRTDEVTPDANTVMKVPGQMRDAILAHTAFCAPEEACGLLAGDPGGPLRMVYCLTNAQHSPAAYTIEPEEHFRALHHAEANGWELVGAFHSHPRSEAYPSPTDRRLAPEPDWIYLIASLIGPDLRGYFIRGGTVVEEPLEIGD